MYIFGIIIGVYLHTSIPFFILVCLLLIAMYMIKKEPNKNKAPIIKKIIITKRGQKEILSIVQYIGEE